MKVAELPGSMNDAAPTLSSAPERGRRLGRPLPLPRRVGTFWTNGTTTPARARKNAETIPRSTQRDKYPFSYELHGSHRDGPYVKRQQLRAQRAKSAQICRLPQHYVMQVTRILSDEALARQLRRGGSVVPCCTYGPPKADRCPVCPEACKNGGEK